MNRRTLILGAAALPLSLIPLRESSAHGADDPVIPTPETGLVLRDVYEQDFLPVTYPNPDAFDFQDQIQDAKRRITREMEERVVLGYRRETWFFSGDDLRETPITVQAIPFSGYGWTWSDGVGQRIYPHLSQRLYPFFVLPPLTHFSFVHLEGRDTPSLVTKVYDDGSYLLLHTPFALWAPSSVQWNAW